MAYEGKQQPIQHGIQRGVAYWQDDFVANIDKEGTVTATHSFRCHLDDVLKLIPKGDNAHCVEPGWEFLGLSEVEVKNIGGKIAEVKCKFGGKPEDSSTDGGDTTIDDAEKDGKTATLTVTTTETPLEMHPRYSSIFFQKSGDKIEGGKADTTVQAILGLKNGRTKLVKDTSSESAKYKIIYRDVNSKIPGVELEPTSLAGEIAALFSSGVTSYLSPRPTLRITYTSRKPPSSSVLNSVGHIVPNSSAILPDEYRAASNRNWLVTGLDSHKEGKVYRITITLMLSEVGGWIRKIYQ